MKSQLTLVATALIALIAWNLPLQVADAADPFPKKVYSAAGSAAEGFAIGKGTTAYNGSVDGSIYKMDLQSGQGKRLVAVQDPDIAGGACVVLGLRVDPRTNYLYAAGCGSGKAFVFDADTGALVREYQLATPGLSIINDLTITQDAVYFTDAAQPFLYRLPLTSNGGLPVDSGAATAIPLPDAFIIEPEVFCCGANGIVATPDGKTLIVGHSNDATLYRVVPATGQVDQISMAQPLDGFLDGIAMLGRTLYIMTPNVPPAPDYLDRIQVVEMAPDMRSGRLVRTITDPDLDGVASGAIFGGSLYVNNARYFDFPGGDTEYWVTKLPR